MKKIKNTTVPQGDTVAQDLNEISKIVEERAKGHNPLFVEKFPFRLEKFPDEIKEQQVKEILDYDFEK